MTTPQQRSAAIYEQAKQAAEDAFRMGARGENPTGIVLELIQLGGKNNLHRDQYERGVAHAKAKKAGM